MTGEIQLISDGDGLLVLGSPAEIDLFLAAEGLRPKAVQQDRLAVSMRSGLAVIDAVSAVSEASGRWVKLTKESAAAVKKYGLMDTKTPGVQQAMIGKPGEIKQWIQIVSSPGSIASNPAVLSGAAGIMAQLAMQQMVDEITDYLAAIDRKLDAVLRTQTNQVLARMDGVEFLLREAASVRETVGRVSEVTWSKIQHSSSVILETQAFALRQLIDVASELERTTKIGELAERAEELEAETRKWLNVLARCVQLHDSVAVIELDRVMDTTPGELDQHLAGLRAARLQRLELFGRATTTLLRRMSAAVEKANSKVLFNPLKSPAVVRSGNEIATSVHDFHDVLAMESERQSAEARRWVDAASETWTSVRESGVEGAEVVKGLSAGTLRQAKSMKEKFSGALADRKSRTSGDGPVADGE